jgi:predicted enzyme related to lactoylglutathione lyase
MINGIHALIYNKEAEKLRAFFSDVLGFRGVDAGHGWLIFALLPAELGVHPTDEKGSHELYLMCDDLQTTIPELEGKGVKLAEPVKDAGWGLLTAIEVPGGEILRLYQPKHPTALGLVP